MEETGEKESWMSQARFKPMMFFKKNEVVFCSRSETVSQMIVFNQ